MFGNSAPHDVIPSTLVKIFSDRKANEKGCFEGYRPSFGEFKQILFSVANSLTPYRIRVHGTADRELAAVCIISQWQGKKLGRSFSCDQKMSLVSTLAVANSPAM